MSLSSRIAVAATITVGVELLIPLPAGAEQAAPPSADKYLHAVFFGALLVLWAWALRPRGVRALAMLGAAVVAYGGLLELVQALTSYRSGDWRDLLADAAGVALAAVLARWMFGVGRTERA